MSEDEDVVDPLIGRVFASRYKIEVKLGAGAMGTVYRARHIKVGRPFAVKMLHERLLTDDKVHKRFDREAELAGKLHHVNVVGVVDVGETEDGIHFMVMEYADGASLGSLVDGPMAAERVIDLVKQMCEGLQHAHEHGLIHRDFKPDNVIVERDRFGTERPRIVDFGIAILRDDAVAPGRADRLTTAGLVLGTPHYMAPEHAMGGVMDHRIDLFALGVICYELLTGQLPFDGDGVDVARANLLTATPPMGVRVPGVAVDPLLEAFTRLLMEKDPARRPQTAKEAQRLLELISTDRAAAAEELDVELPEGDPFGQRTQQSAPLTTSSANTFTNRSAPRPSKPPPVGTPHTRAVTVPERPGAAVVTSDGRRASTSPGEVRRAVRTPVVTEDRPAEAGPVEGRRAGSDQGDGQGARTYPGEGRRTETQPGRERRAATVLPPPRRLFAIGLGAGLVVAIAVIVMVARRGGGSSPAPIGAAPAIAGAPLDAGAGGPAVDAPTATAGDPMPVTDGAEGITPAPADAGPLVPIAADAGATVTPDPGKPKPPKPPRPPRPPKPPEPPAVFDTSSTGVAQLYGTVGRELKALDGRRGTTATSTLWPRYLRIRINDAISTEAKRLEAHRELTALRKAIAAQR